MCVEYWVGLCCKCNVDTVSVIYRLLNLKVALVYR